MIFQLGQTKKVWFDDTSSNYSSTGYLFPSSAGTLVQDEAGWFVSFNNTTRFHLQNVQAAHVLDGSCPSHFNLTAHVQLVHLVHEFARCTGYILRGWYASDKLIVGLVSTVPVYISAILVLLGRMILRAFATHWPLKRKRERERHWSRTNLWWWNRLSIYSTGEGLPLWHV